MSIEMTVYAEYNTTEPSKSGGALHVVNSEGRTIVIRLSRDSLLMLSESSLECVNRIDHFIETGERRNAQGEKESDSLDS